MTKATVELQSTWVRITNSIRMSTKYLIPHFDQMWNIEKCYNVIVRLTFDLWDRSQHQLLFG